MLILESSERIEPSSTNFAFISTEAGGRCPRKSTVLGGIVRVNYDRVNVPKGQRDEHKDSPEPREVQTDGEIEGVVVPNGLHHFYFRKAA